MGGETTWEPTDPLLERLRHDLARRDGITVDVARLKYPDRRRPWTADPMAAARAHGYQPTPRGGLSAEEAPCASA